MRLYPSSSTHFTLSLPTLFAATSSSSIERSLIAVDELMHHPPCSPRILLPMRSPFSPPPFSHSRLLSTRPNRRLQLCWYRPLRTFSRSKACLNSLAPRFHCARIYRQVEPYIVNISKESLAAQADAARTLQVTRGGTRARLSYKDIIAESVGRQVRRRKRRRRRQL